ncbi:glycosyltransferase family 2 protein [Synechococcus sp. CC9616]|uniref:glycosyltransferase family 2 protein n=1 Tax=Synechococcus sp. CC9616 TaxID=110663 RepID=UPI00048AEDC9|nr:glycosyltransferase family 2 protein [Synechococcus sp. CC9616]
MRENKKLNIKLIAIAKNEAPYIAPWVFHHFRIGIDSIEIYINNTDDNSVKICKGIRKVEPRFNFVRADKIFKKSLAKKRSFQITAYNRALKKAQKSKESITHLLILDLDEYLTQRNLDGNFKKFLRRSLDSDVVSFLWYSDDFGNRKKAFGNIFDNPTTLYRMDHVKSIVKISPKLKSCSHHNFIFEDQSNPKNTFSSLRKVQLSDGDNSSFNRCKINKDFLDRLNPKTPEKWFVLHQIYRSEPEYLASLCRGRKHNNDNSLLKVNRWGRQPYPYYKSKSLRIRIQPKKLEAYNHDFRQFTKKTKMKRKLRRAQRMVLATAKHLDQLIKEDLTIISTYKNIFSGTIYDN